MGDQPERGVQFEAPSEDRKGERANLTGRGAGGRPACEETKFSRYSLYQRRLLPVEKEPITRALEGGDRKKQSKRRARVERTGLSNRAVEERKPCQRTSPYQLEERKKEGHIRLSGRRSELNKRQLAPSYSV